MQPIRSIVALAHVMNFEVSLDYYQKLGFEIGNTFTPEGASVPIWAWMKSGDAQLMLAQADVPINRNEQGILFYVYVDDVAAKHAELSAAGLAPAEIKYPFYARGGEFRVTDPDGYALLITHYGEPQ